MIPRMRSFDGSVRNRVFKRAGVAVALLLCPVICLAWGGDTADFNLVAANFSLAGRWFTGDFNYDGTVDTADFNLLAANFGSALSGDVLASHTVPEPPVVAFAVTALSLLRRRRLGTS